MFRRCAFCLAAGLLLPALSSAQSLKPIAVDDVKSVDDAKLDYVNAALLTNYCYRASSRFWYDPAGVWVYNCYRAPDEDSDGCYEWHKESETLVYDGDYTLADSCEECSCTDPCFTDPSLSAF